MLHGNYEQAATQAGCSSVAEFFKKQFAGEVESMFRITDYVIAQIDQETGLPR